MERFRTSAWWIWPIVPAVAVVVFLLTNRDTQGACPPGPGPLSIPNPDGCLPKLLPSITGADPILVALSWLLVGAAIYLVGLTVSYFVRTQGFR